MSDYEFIRKRTNKFGGGIAFHMNGSFPSQNVKIKNTSGIEVLTIEIAIRKNKILLAVIYKLANLSETDFTTNLENIISKRLNKWPGLRVKQISANL